jgi:CDGSH-type Zn-finger protein
MTTYSLRCRHNACRHRRVSAVHPDEAKRVYRCPICKNIKGWRIETRDYNKVGICTCGQSPHYPHRVGKYKFCDFHPEGIINQARRRGATDDDIPLEAMGVYMKASDDCPF